MDYKIHVGSSLNPKEVLASKDQTPKELLKEQNMHYQDGQVQHQGRVLGTNEMDKPLEELGVQDDDYITVVSKQNSGGEAL